MMLNSQSLSKEQVLIVGCGDIGQRFARALSPDHYQVTGLRRSRSPDVDGLRFIVCDATDENQLSAVIRAGHFAVILISMTPSERSDAGYERAYLQTCRNVVAALAGHSHQPRLVLFISSTGVYGQNDGSWVDEQSPTNPDGFSGRRLLEAEACLQQADIASLIARFSGIYGPGRRRLIAMVERGEGSFSGNISNRIHADDGAAALAYLVEQGRHKLPLQSVYLVTDSAPVAMHEVTQWLAERLGSAQQAKAKDAGERGNKRCSNARLLASGFQLRYPDYIAGYAALLALE